MSHSQINFNELTNFSARQKQFEAYFDLPKKFLLYGGAAGGGKSYALRWMAVKRLLTFAERGLQGVRIGLFCEDYPSLKDRQISKIPFEFPNWLGTLNKSEHDYVLAPEYGGGIISFRNLDDPAKYLSAEFADIYVDELTRNPRDTFDFLVTRLRWKGIEDSKFIAGTNPGQKGHGWVKKLWIDHNFDNEKYDPADFAFVRALPTDNPYLPKDYINSTLANLPDHLRRAYLEGDWDIFAGQFFTEFRRDSHVITPFVDANTLAWFKALPTYCGLDYGYSAESAVLWGKFHDDTWYIYRELYQTGLTYDQLADAIRLIEVPEMIYADPAIWAKKDSPTSGADVFKAKGLRVKAAMNDRVIGWTVLKTTMKNNCIKIYDSCNKLIETLPQMVYNERAEAMKEDMETHGVPDHLPDACRYLINSHKNIVPQKKPFTYMRQQGKMIADGRSEIDTLFDKRQRANFLPSYKR